MQQSILSHFVWELLKTRVLLWNLNPKKVVASGRELTCLRTFRVDLEIYALTTRG